jgi:hypothetical protein
MDKFVIGRVVSAIDYALTQFSIKLAVPATLTTPLSSLIMAGTFFATTPHREDALLQWSPQLDVGIGSPKSSSAYLT